MAKSPTTAMAKSPTERTAPRRKFEVKMIKVDRESVLRRADVF